MVTGEGHQSTMQRTDEGFIASASALDQLTSSAENKNQDPKTHLHLPANHEFSHTWLSKVFPASELQHLETRCHMGNYVVDRKTGEKAFEPMSIYVRVGMHLLYYGSEQEKALHWRKTLELLKAESEKMGREYDAPESKAHIMPFIESFQLQETLFELKKPDPSSYTTFNEFFSREIKEEARPIDEPDNDLVSSSPADCRLTAFQTIDLATKYWIKGYGFSLARLLGDDTLATQFDGGSVVIARLAPQDYHRWHSPVTGTVEGIRDIPGTYYTVNPQAINEAGALDVFCENKRSVMLLKRSWTGSPIAIVAVGAMLVGSINYVAGVDRVGTAVRRGQCLGAFAYGGSTVLVLYPRGEIGIDGDLVRNSTEASCETLMRVGWRVGVQGLD